MFDVLHAFQIKMAPARSHHDTVSHNNVVNDASSKNAGAVTLASILWSAYKVNWSVEQPGTAGALPDISKLLSIVLHKMLHSSLDIAAWHQHATLNATNCTCSE